MIPSSSDAVMTETSSLLSRRRGRRFHRGVVIILLATAALGAFSVVVRVVFVFPHVVPPPPPDMELDDVIFRVVPPPPPPTSTQNSTPPPDPHHFPDHFVWGVATSAYQIEGAVEERGRTIWDSFVLIPGNVLDGSTGNVADDHYHLFVSDVALIKSLHLQAYRCSIAWSRLLPTGRGTVSAVGIQFYHDLIDELLRQNIEPWLTLFHWDLPQALQDENNGGGWTNVATISAFVEYAELVFQEYGHKVKRFITINEPWTYSVVGHGSGVHAPGRKDHPSTEPYIVAHHLLLAHSQVAQLYQTHYNADGNGRIGISNCGDYRYPHNAASARDIDAAQRAMLFQWGWFVEPLVVGDYPAVMRERLGDRLPRFTSEEQQHLMGSTDFLGLNYYSALRASTPDTESTYYDYWADMHVNFTDDPTWRKNDMGWNVVPDGLREMLRWISERYQNPLIYITENGSAEPEIEDAPSVIHDEARRLFLEAHIGACAEALYQHGVNLAGYFAWSFMDNFEWQYGYQRRFGICHVNYTTQQRTPRDSALWYRSFIRRHKEIHLPDHPTGSRPPPQQSHGNSRSLKATEKLDPASRRQRPTQLPAKVLIGYGSDCDAVRQAVYNGVNIVIWSFIDVVQVDIATYTPSASNQFRNLVLNSDDLRSGYTISTTLNLTAVGSLILDLSMSGYSDVLHFASVGGWNGAHINTDIPPSLWYEIFTETIGDIFDGIDWDLEGNDMLGSPYNFFTIECITNMGIISQLFKKDGKFVSIAPPQSYMNIKSSRFSRYVNLTDSASTRPTPYSSFTYYGSNVYAYLVHQYGDWIDLISIQFYESYSDASYEIRYNGYNASEYLFKYVDDLISSEEVFFVNFTEDAEIGLSGQKVALPIQKLILGFGNGWTRRNDKCVYISPDQVCIAWRQLHAASPSKLPRGFMFWSINTEGEDDLYLAKALHEILQSQGPF